MNKGIINFAEESQFIVKDKIVYVEIDKTNKKQINFYLLNNATMFVSFHTEEETADVYKTLLDSFTED